MHRRVPTGMNSSWVGGQDCGRQFVNNPSRQPVSQEKRNLIDKLLKERLALAAMASPAPEAHRAGNRGFRTLVARLC